MLCGPSCRVRRRARRRQPAVPLRCRAKVLPSAFLCRLSCAVGRYAPLLGATSFFAALPSTTAVAIAITVTAVVIAAALKAELTAADPDAEVGARSAGLIRFLSIPLPSGKRGSAHHSVRRLMACYPVLLRMGAPEHSPWRVPRDDLNSSSYQQRIQCG